MGALAFVFSGQGDQHPGMGQALYSAYPAAAQVFDQLESLRPGTLGQCFSGSDEELKQTCNTQPCLFAFELAAAEILLQKGIRPAAVAGFSLGEVAAATVAGCFDRETGFRLVCKRGQLMQAAAEQLDTAMVAVVKLPEETVIRLCQQNPGIYPVNFNCPGQITVSGLAQQMPAFATQVKAAGGRALPLRVKGGFHSPYMAQAASAFSAELEQVSMMESTIPLYSNVTAEPYAANPAALLAQQIQSPVRWEQLIRNMISSGIDTFVEIGPGKTLCGMIRKIDAAVTAYSVMEYLEELP